MLMAVADASLGNTTRPATATKNVREPRKSLVMAGPASELAIAVPACRHRKASGTCDWIYRVICNGDQSLEGSECKSVHSQLLTKLAKKSAARLKIDRRRVRSLCGSDLDPDR